LGRRYRKEPDTYSLSVRPLSEAFITKLEDLIMKKNFFFLLILGLPLTALPINDYPKFQQWESLTEVVYYAPDNLWEYINGAADQFIDYGFSTVGVGEFKTEGIQFSVDIYDMGSPLNAFGVYATESKGVKNRYRIGAEAAISLPSQALMIKGNYYVKLYVFEGELQEILGKTILNDIADKLAGSMTMPPELHNLPESGRIDRSEGYTRLGFLGLSDLKNCLYADYLDKEGEKYHYFMVQPDQDQTPKDIFEKFGEGWELQKWKNYSIKIRKIPYQGMTTIILLPAGIFGVSNSTSQQVATERLKAFIP